MLKSLINIFTKINTQEKCDPSSDLLRYKTWVPSGHYYSPIPDINQIRQKENKIWGNMPDNIQGVDLNIKEQLSLLVDISLYYHEVPFEDKKKNNLRYYFENKFYSYGDAIILYSMIRHLKPDRIIEVGSGFSSCVTLDTNELFFKNEIACAFIEPYPERLFSLIKNEDRENCKIIEKDLQEIDIDLFRGLKSNDILFVDSTHVSKINSDVNYIFSKILPILNDGVYIHFHDIFYPFEYPKEWVYEGRAWNEAYILRAFLQFNSSFKIMFWNTYLYQYYRDILQVKMPLCLKNIGGSIWLRKMKLS